MYSHFCFVSVGFYVSILNLNLSLPPLTNSGYARDFVSLSQMLYLVAMVDYYFHCHPQSS